MSITLSELREQIRALEDAGSGGGPHTHDWSDVTGEPSTFPPAEHDSTHDDRFSLLAHTHPAGLGVLGYAQVVANQSGLAALADLTGLSIAVTVAASRRIRVTLWCLGAISTVAGDRGQAHIREGTTTLTRSLHRFDGTTTESGFCVIWVGTPSAGSHTYKGSYERASGTGTHSWVADAQGPSFILVEDIGAA